MTLPPDRKGTLVWVAACVAAAALVILSLRYPGLKSPPDSVQVNLEAHLNTTIRAIADFLKPLSRAIAWTFEWPIRWIRAALLSLPWITLSAATVLIGARAGGLRLAMLVGAALLYIVLTGYWQQSMTTLALIAVAVPLSVAAGLLIGIAAHRDRSVRAVVTPLLDLMQAVPTFAYLIPMLVLFGVGPVVGLLASAIYAVPPMVRNVMLGLDRVPVDVLEPARMAGVTPRQEMWWVKIPTAMPAVLLGVNQTIMAVLGMVVIASILGGLPDIGWEVYSTMKKAQFGQSILAGLVIALIAIVLDRISQGLAAGRPDFGRSHRVRDMAIAVGVLAVTLVLAWVVPVLREFPTAWRIYPAAELNAALDWFTRNFFWVTNAIKNSAVFYLLLPLKIGFVQAATPFSWGFDVTPTIAGIYWAVAVLACAATVWRRGVAAGVAVAACAALYFFGLLGLPWLAIVAFVSGLAFLAGGRGLAAFSLAAFLFIATSGAWESAMLSLELTLAGVVIAFMLGSAIGIIAALSDRFSTAIRPVNDTLQTMPSFVFLIPAIMIFLVGEFTALVAIVLYAIVPSIRYAEHGIRNVPAHIIEAATACGTTRWQLFRHVQLPLAVPELMLGLNQTIMMALAMVVVAALVGAQGLGQDIMVALTWMDVGKGFVFGLAVALIAIIADRITQGWSAKRKETLGLAARM